MVTLTRVVEFPATHRMWLAGLSPEENRSRFGSVSEYHGHDYRCAVTVSGPVDPASGMIMDLALLDQLIQDAIVAPFGGRTLNTDVPELASGRPLPTCEALASIAYARLAARLPAGVRLERVRVSEDATLYAECFPEP